MCWSSVKRTVLLINSVKRKAGIIAKRMLNTFKAPFTQWVHTAVWITMINVSTALWTKLNIFFLRWESQSTKTLNDLSAWIGSRAKNQVVAWLNLLWYYCSSQLLSHLYYMEVTSSAIQLEKDNFYVWFLYNSHHSAVLIVVFCLFHMRFAFYSPMTPSCGFNFYCINSGLNFEQDKLSHLVWWWCTAKINMWLGKVISFLLVYNNSCELCCLLPILRVMPCFFNGYTVLPWSMGRTFCVTDQGRSSLSQTLCAKDASCPFSPL